MAKIFRAYQLINILSLDVAAGAMVCATFFARILEVTILPHGLIALGLTVWIIYTADHLLDARKSKQTAATERHRFHQRYFKMLMAIMILAVLLDASQIYFIRSIVFVAGLWLSFFVTIYFFIQQRLGFLKELLAALLYTSGVLLIPFSVKSHLASTQILLVFQFGITAWINLLLFSWIDRPLDERDSHRSFATTYGERTTFKALWILLVLSGVLTITQLLLFPLYTEVILTITSMNGLLLLIFMKKEIFEQKGYYRLLGDSIFLLPIIYLLM